MVAFYLQSRSFSKLFGEHLVDPSLLSGDFVVEFLFVDLQELAIYLILFDTPPHAISVF